MNRHKNRKALTALLMAIGALIFLCGARENVFYHVTYKAQNNKVILSSVCANYERHSIAFRGCRSQAATLFKTECAKYRNLVQAINPSPNPNDRTKMDLFCDAHKSFSPIVIH